MEELLGSLTIFFLLSWNQTKQKENFQHDLQSIQSVRKLKFSSHTVFHDSFLFGLRKENCHHDQIPLNFKGKLSPRSYSLNFKRKTDTTIIFH